jgi:hypothetical protein
MWNDPSYAGGAVWMFHDQGILRKADDMSADERRNCVWPDKDHVWDSARDLGTDGVVYSDRTLQSDYFEMRKVYAPVRLGVADVKFDPGGRLRFSAPVENRFDSVALDKGAKGRWRLFADRREVAGGELGIPPLPPHAKGVLSFEADSPGAEASIWRLELSFDSPRTGFSLYERSYPVKVELPRTEAAGDIALGFDAATKEVVVRSSGAEIFRSPVLARVDRRSMLSKDRKTNQYDRWTPNALEPSSVEVVSCGDGHLTLDVLWRPKAHTSKKDVKGRRELSGRISLKAESGKIKVDDVIGAFRAHAGVGLDEFPRQVVGFVEQKQTDLRHMGAGGDVDITVVIFTGKIMVPAVFIKFAVNLFKVPWILHGESFGDDLGRWRTLFDIFDDPFFQAFEFGLIDQMIAVKVQIVLHGKRNGRTPDVPTGKSPGFAVAVKSGAQK